MINYVEKLDEINNDFYCKDKPYCLSSFNDGMRKYSEFIKEFFSRNNEASNITHIYDAIKNGSLKDKTIMTYDVNFAAKAFLDYIQGMKEFMRDASHAEASEFTSYMDKVKNVEGSFNTFMGNIFGGYLNKEVPTKVSDAITNLEVLVDIVDQGDSHVADIDSIECSNEVCSKMKEFFFNCIKEYYHYLITGIITTYNKIKEVMDTPASSTECSEYKLL